MKINLLPLLVTTLAWNMEILSALANVPPTLSPLPNIVLNKGDRNQTVVLSGIGPGAPGENQTLSVIALSSNPNVIPNPTITYTSPNPSGTLTFTPQADSFGVAVISVMINDGQPSDNIVTRSFLVIVNPVNSPPTLDPIPDLAVNENAGDQTVVLSGISPGAPGENQTLSIIALSSNPDLIPNPVVTYTSPNSMGTLTFRPVAGKFGVAVISVTVNDGQASDSIVTRSFLVSVTPVNQHPTLDPIPNVVINDGAGDQTVILSGISSGTPGENQTLSIIALSSNPELIPNPIVTYTSPSSMGTLTFRTVADKFGVAVITVTVNDGQASDNTVTRSFLVTVNAAMRVAKAGNDVMLSWTVTNGVLQHCSNIGGLWEDVLSEPRSPYTVSPSGVHFYRLRQR